MSEGFGDGRGPVGRVSSMDHVDLSHLGAERGDMASAAQWGVVVAG